MTAEQKLSELVQAATEAKDAPDLKAQLAALNRAWFALDAAQKAVYTADAEARFQAYRAANGFTQQEQTIQ